MNILVKFFFQIVLGLSIIIIAEKYVLKRNIKDIITISNMLLVVVPVFLTLMGVNFMTTLTITGIVLCIGKLIFH